MNPAERVINKCGGVAVVAKLVGRSEGAVHRWKYEREKGGTGGFVPSEVADALLKAARSRGIDLSPDDFFEKPVVHGSAHETTASNLQKISTEIPTHGDGEAA